MAPILTAVWRRQTAVSTVRLLVLLAISVAGLPARGKDYRVDKIAIDVIIRPDGSVRFAEKRVYAFRGEFSWADYRLPLAGIAGVESLRVWEGDQQFHRKASGEPGTFSVDSTRDLFQVRWHFRARNQTRVFHLSYVIPALIHLHRDVAELNHIFIGAGDRKPVAEVLVRVSWDRRPPADSLRVWLHASAGADAHYAFENGVLVIGAHRLLPDQALGARIVFPKSCVFRATGPSDELALPDISEQEALWSKRMEKARREYEERQRAFRERQRHALWFVCFLTLAGFAIAGYFWLRFGKSHRVRGVPRVLTEPPSDWTPAQVAYLLRGGDFGPEALVATLFDLVRKRVLELELEAGSAKKPRFRLRKAEAEIPLQPWEQEIVRFVFGELSPDGREISSEDLMRARKKLRQWFFRWKRNVVRWGEEAGIFEGAGRVARNRTLAIAGALVAMGVLYMFLAGWVGLIPFFGGLVLFVVAFGMHRRSPEAQAELLRWRAFARYLQRVSRAREPMELENTVRDRSWLFALVLGFPSRRFRKLTEKLFGSEGVPWLGIPVGSLSSVVAAVNVVGSVAGVGGGPAVGGTGGAVGGAG